jgi:hypothetical protein
LRKLLYFIPFLLLAWVSTYLSSCKKDVLFSKENLSFSVDTVLFDTVFTTVGSTTKRFKIYNTSNRPVKIDQVVLEGGQNSPYRVNLDGVSGITFSDVVLPANDSLFMFVEVTLGENNDPNIFIIQDRIRFETNGKDQFVQLDAWGQDAYFYTNEAVSGSWGNDKPHVIYNIALVDSMTSLTIEAGAKVYMHKGAILFVNKGTLTIDGDYNNKVVIQGDRLEPFYSDVSGQYYGIYFNEARSSIIDNAIIKNGTAGVHVFGNNSSNAPSDYTLTITNTEIFNQARYGIFNYSGGKIYGENLNVHSNGQYAYFLLEGGSHNFRHSQFLSYGSEGNQPAVAIKNYFTRSDNITYIGAVNEGAFYNSIIYGDGDFQIAYDTLTQNGTVTIDKDYNTNSIRQVGGSNISGFANNQWNQNPLFENIEDQNFKISWNSPCKGQGVSPIITVFNTDITGISRSTPPDIGAYEVP